MTDKEKKTQEIPPETQENPQNQEITTLKEKIILLEKELEVNKTKDWLKDESEYRYQLLVTIQAIGGILRKGLNSTNQQLYDMNQILLKREEKPRPVEIEEPAGFEPDEEDDIPSPSNRRTV